VLLSNPDNLRSEIRITKLASQPGRFRTITCCDQERWLQSLRFMAKPARLPSMILVPLSMAVCAGTMSYPSYARSGPFRPEATASAGRIAASQRPQKARPLKAYDEYQVAAGTALPIDGGWTAQ
jgi:hypothetical protein